MVVLDLTLEPTLEPTEVGALAASGTRVLEASEGFHLEGDIGITPEALGSPHLIYLVQ